MLLAVFYIAFLDMPACEAACSELSGRSPYSTLPVFPSPQFSSLCACLFFFLSHIDMTVQAVISVRKFSSEIFSRIYNKRCSYSNRRCLYSVQV